MEDIDITGTKARIYLFLVYILLAITLNKSHALVDEPIHFLRKVKDPMNRSQSCIDKKCSLNKISKLQQ